MVWGKEKVKRKGLSQDKKFITTRDVSHILKVTEKEVIDFANMGLIPHVKIGGEFLRFKREDILKVKEEINKKYNISQIHTDRFESLKEFLYFNDFYIISFFIIVFLLWAVVKDITFLPAAN
ncbi:MAG: helix-turn-helix domain-containing protein [Candidatus Omnitrophota bacterium]